MNNDTPGAAIRRVVEVFEQMNVAWFLTGSIASSLHGLPRSTNDLDIVMALSPSAVGHLVEQLGDGYFADAVMIRQAILKRQSCNLIWLETMMKIDLIPPRFAFDGEAMQRRVKATIDEGQGTTLSVMVASAEDTILAKLFWYQAGGQTSQRQVSDVRGIISVQGSRLEQAYLDKWIETLALGDVWRTVSKP
jgi:hypothetical protein